MSQTICVPGFMPNNIIPHKQSGFLSATPFSIECHRDKEKNGVGYIGENHRHEERWRL